MADVFVSYSREERPRVAPFVELLENQGWTVWWDTEVGPGYSFSDEIEKQLSTAACVVVFWSRHSIQSNWVQVEANEGLERGVLVPLALDDVRPPLAFRGTETVPLIGWPQHEQREQLERALRAIARNVGQESAPLSLKHRRPGLLGKRIAIAAITLAVIAGAGFYYYKDDLNIGPGKSIPAKPAASIAVLPFSNMEVDIAPELSRLLNATGSFLVESQDQVQAYLKHPMAFDLDARYTVQGTESPTGLTVSVFDRNKGETLWTRTLKTKDKSVSKLVQTIASGVAGVFNRPEIRVDDVPHDAYVEFLQARGMSQSDLSQAGNRRVEALYKSVIARAPRFAEAYAGLCQTYTTMYRNTRDVKYFQLAEQRCFRASALSDDNASVDTALGELYRISGRLDASLERLEAARKKTPFSTEVLRQLAMVKQQLKLDDEAKALLQYAQELEPNDWKNYAALASLYFDTGRYSDAAHEYEMSMKLSANKAHALNDVAVAWYMAGDYQKAIDAWQASLDDGGNPGALSNLGSAYFYNQNFNKAVETYEKSLKLHPEDARLWSNTGDAVMHTGRDASPYFEKAIELTQAQLKINPNDGNLLGLAAACYAALGKDEESRDYIARALTAAKDNPDALYGIAVAYGRLGEEAKKEDMLKRMIAGGYPRKLIYTDANLNGGKAK